MAEEVAMTIIPSSSNTEHPAPPSSSALPPSDILRRFKFLCIKIKPERTFVPVFINMIQDRVRSLGLFMAIFLMAYTIVAAVIFDPIVTEPRLCDIMSEKKGGQFLVNVFVEYTEAKINITAMQKLYPNRTFEMPSYLRDPRYTKLSLCGEERVPQGGIAKLMPWQAWLVVGHFVVLGAYMANSAHMRVKRAAFQCFWSILIVGIGAGYNLYFGGLGLLKLAPTEVYDDNGNVLVTAQRPVKEITNATVLTLIVSSNAAIMVLYFLVMAVFSSKCLEGTKIGWQSYHFNRGVEMAAHVRQRLTPADKIVEAARVAHETSIATVTKRKLKMALEGASAGPAKKKAWVAGKVYNFTQPYLVVGGPSVQKYLDKTAYFRFPLRFWACVWLLLLLWVLLMMGARTVALYLTRWGNLLIRFLTAFEILQRTVIEGVDATQSAARGLFGMVETFTGYSAFDVQYVDLFLQFAPSVTRMPIGTIRTVILIVNIAFGVAPAIGIITLSFVMLRNGLNMRTDILQARRAGWRSILIIPTESQNYAARFAANYVGLQVAVIILSTVFIALVAAGVLTPVVLVALKVIKINLTPKSFLRVDLFLKTLGPLFILRQLALLTCRFYANTKAGEISRLRIFCLLDFLLLFLNILGGWVVALVRLIAAVIRVFLNFPRLNYPVTPTHWHDPGYVAYVATVRISSSVYNHPIAVVFHTTLTKTVKARRTVIPVKVPIVGVATYRSVSTDASPELAARRRIIRNRFWLWITLLHNPSLQSARKRGAQQMLLE